MEDTEEKYTWSELTVQDESMQDTGVSAQDFWSSHNLSQPITISSLDVNSINWGLTQGNTAPNVVLGGTGSTQINWSPSYNTNNGTTYTWGNTNTNGNITLQGNVAVEGDNADIVIRGQSLMSMLQQIQQRLNLIVPNLELEAEWDELRELGEQYRALEQQCQERAKMWTALKSMPPVKLDK